MAGFAWAEQGIQDICFGVRNLRNASGFMSSAVLSLALGIGTTTAIGAVSAPLLIAIVYNRIVSVKSLPGTNELPFPLWICSAMSMVSADPSCR